MHTAPALPHVVELLIGLTDLVALTSGQGVNCSSLNFSDLFENPFAQRMQSFEKSLLNSSKLIHRCVIVWVI